MTFTFDPAADYYELFEYSMADPALEKLMDDVENYDEFLGLLRDGLYPINDEPLSPENHKALVAFIGRCCAANNSWFTIHTTAAVLL